MYIHIELGSETVLSNVIQVVYLIALVKWFILITYLSLPLSTIID